VTDGVLDAIVVGGGLAGLAAGWELRDLDVLVLEAEDRLGGRILSAQRGDYWLNLGAHVFGAPESATGRLLTSLDVDAVQVPGHLAAVSLNGRLVAGGAVELFPLRLRMAPGARLSLVRAGLKLRRAVGAYGRIARPREGEHPSVRQARLLEYLDDRSFSDFIGPLAPDVDALFRSTLTRSSGEPEELAAGYGVGYFHLVWNRAAGLSRNVIGGSSRLIEALARSLAGHTRTNARVLSVAPESDAVRVRFSDGTGLHELRCRTAVVATPAYVTREIVEDIPRETARALESIPYGPYVVGAFRTSERSPMRWDGLYALATPNRSFSMLFNTANVIRTQSGRRPAGTLMVYAAATLASRLDELDDAAVEDRFTSDLYELFPEARGLVDEVVIKRWHRGLPYPRPGRARLQPALTRSLEPVYLAGDYLGTWYTETAVQTALDAARSVRSRLLR
jgi:protoporphyrinogen/coproporphyrinogen III oxidase